LNTSFINTKKWDKVIAAFLKQLLAALDVFCIALINMLNLLPKMHTFKLLFIVKISVYLLGTLFGLLLETPEDLDQLK